MAFLLSRTAFGALLTTCLVTLPVAAMTTAPLTKEAFNLAVEKAAADCSKQSLFETARRKALSTVGKFSIDGKAGPQIACLSIVPPELQAGEAVKKSGFGIKAPEDSRSVREMTEYMGRDREQLVLAPKYKAFVEARLIEIQSYWPKNVPPPAINAKDIKVYISNTPADNALAFIDDSIVVSTGLIQHASEDEFMFVLAHEYVHIAAQHNRKDQARFERRKFVRLMAQSFTVADYFANTTFGMDAQNSITTNTDTVKFVKAVSKVEASKSRLIYINDTFINPGWSRGLEDEADAVAFDLLLNRDASHADLYLKYFQDTTTGEEAQKAIQNAMIDLYGDNMQEALDLNTLVSDDGNLDADAWVKSVGGNIQTGLRQGITAFLKRDHIADAERRDGLRRYVETAYNVWPTAPSFVLPPAPAQPPPAAVPAKKGKGAKSKAPGAAGAAQTYDGIRNGLEITNLVALRKSTDGFLEAKATGNDAVVAAKLSEILRNPMNDQAYVHYELWRYYDELSDRQAAARQFDAMLGHEFSSARIYTDAARSLAVRGKTAQALTLSEQGATRFNDKNRFIPTRVYIAFKAKDSKALQAAYSECEATSRPELIRECEAARSEFEQASDTQKGKSKKSAK